MVSYQHHEYSQSVNDNLTQDKHQNYNLLRWHAIDWWLFRSYTHNSRHSNLPSATSMIFHKLEKDVLGLTIVTLEISLKQNKNSESSFRMSEFVKKSTNINSVVDKVDWNVDANYSSSFTSNVEFSFPPNATNIIFIGKSLFCRQNCFEQKLKNQTEMLGTKLGTVQWSSVNSTA